jgi:PAS domain S-box-containing protein
LFLLAFLLIKMDIEQLDKEPPTISLPLVAQIDEQFMVMANSAPILLWASGSDKLAFFFNKAWLQYTGRTMEEEAGDGWYEGVHPSDLEKYFKLYNKAFDKKKEFKIEYRLRRFDGKYRWVLDNGQPHFTKDKIFAGYIGSCIDIHEIKELEGRKNQFITAASHELKTPVTSLSIYLHLIAEFLKSNQEEKYAAYATSAITQVNKITGLINQLLDLSRIESDSLNFEWSVFSLYELVNSIVDKIQSTTLSHKIEIKGNCRGNIEGDKERLSQAIENLLTNAIKFSQGHNKIIVELSENTKYMQVSIVDFGIGIDKFHLPKIFERFYRIPGQKEETFPGLGIGLFISQQIIKKHGGKIWAESIQNKETKFNFQIPIFKKMFD